MTMRDIYAGAERLLKQLISAELTAQGHTLTGKLEQSLKAKTKLSGDDKVMEGLALYYAQFVNEGFPAKSASMKQFPFVYRYWLARGLKDSEARQAAGATIRKWMKEGGMPTQNSKQFSTTGTRKFFVDTSVNGDEKLNDYMTGALDFAHDEQFHKTKSETI